MAAKFFFILCAFIVPSIGTSQKYMETDWGEFAVSEKILREVKKFEREKIIIPSTQSVRQKKLNEYLAEKELNGKKFSIVVLPLKRIKSSKSGSLNWSELNKELLYINKDEIYAGILANLSSFESLAILEREHLNEIKNELNLYDDFPINFWDYNDVIQYGKVLSAHYIVSPEVSVVFTAKITDSERWWYKNSGIKFYYDKEFWWIETKIHYNIKIINVETHQSKSIQMSIPLDYIKGKLDTMTGKWEWIKHV